MAVLKCGVHLNDGCFVTCDGVAYQGKLWLVPGWIEHPSKPIAKAKRLIRFDCFPHKASKDKSTDYQNIELPMPESALLGPVPAGIEYIDQPANVFAPIEELRRQYM